MVVTRQMAQTFSQWLLRDIEQRHITARQYAKLVGITHTTINDWLELDTAEKPSYPSIKKLIKLANGSKTDLCALISLLWPEGGHPDAEVILLAERIKRLPIEKRKIVDDWLIGTTLDILDKSN